MEIIAAMISGGVWGFSVAVLFILVCYVIMLAAKVMLFALGWVFVLCLAVVQALYYFVRRKR